MKSQRSCRGHGRGGPINQQLALEDVRSRLDALAERRLHAPLTQRESRNWDELVALEQLLLHRNGRAELIDDANGFAGEGVLGSGAPAGGAMPR